ncbi:hypothetical protein DSECCO2_599290 [anaerobic digester metagenome]
MRCRADPLFLLIKHRMDLFKDLVLFDFYPFDVLVNLLLLICQEIILVFGLVNQVLVFEFPQGFNDSFFQFELIFIN